MAPVHCPIAGRKGEIPFIVILSVAVSISSFVLGWAIGFVTAVSGRSILMLLLDSAVATYPIWGTDGTYIAGEFTFLIGAIL